MRLTEVRNVPEEPEAIPRVGTEDAINLESLEVLATCPNVEIREAYAYSMGYLLQSDQLSVNQSLEPL